jgi:hypothetical protein
MGAKHALADSLLLMMPAGPRVFIAPRECADNERDHLTGRCADFPFAISVIAQ